MGPSLWEGSARIRLILKTFLDLARNWANGWAQATQFSLGSSTQLLEIWQDNLQLTCPLPDSLS